MTSVQFGLLRRFQVNFGLERTLYGHVVLLPNGCTIMKTLLILAMLLLPVTAIAEDCQDVIVQQVNGPDLRCKMCGGVVRFCY